MLSTKIENATQKVKKNMEIKKKTIKDLAIKRQELSFAVDQVTKIQNTLLQSQRDFNDRQTQLENQKQQLDKFRLDQQNRIDMKFNQFSNLNMKQREIEQQRLIAERQMRQASLFHKQQLENNRLNALIGAKAQFDVGSAIINQNRENFKGMMGAMGDLNNNLMGAFNNLGTGLQNAFTFSINNANNNANALNNKLKDMDIKLDEIKDLLGALEKGTITDAQITVYAKKCSGDFCWTRFKGMGPRDTGGPFDGYLCQAGNHFITTEALKKAISTGTIAQEVHVNWGNLYKFRPDEKDCIN